MKQGPAHIVLLTGEIFAPFLRDYLLGRIPDISISVAPSIPTLEAALQDAGRACRLISFLTSIIVPAAILRRLGPEPFNIHPGPPEIRGINPEVFAIFDDADSFGVTAHVIAPKVDSGPIIYCERFAMPVCRERRTLADQALPYALKAFRHVADHCAASLAPMARVDTIWTGPLRTLKAFDALGADADRLARACGEDAMRGHPPGAATHPPDLQL